MKSFEAVNFDPTQAGRELAEFRNLLLTNTSLSDRKGVKPFFFKRKQLSALIGTNLSGVGDDLLAYEWQILGDFAADIVVGNRKTGTFSMVELEAGSSDSIFLMMALGVDAQHG